MLMPFGFYLVKTFLLAQPSTREISYIQIGFKLGRGEYDG